MKSNGKDQSQSSAARRMFNSRVVPVLSDSALEWRRMFAEIRITFLLVLVAASGGVVREGNE
jgi:hypothetical protein